MSEDKKPKRIRQKAIKVVVTDAEKEQIEKGAAQCKLSTSQYLRDLGLGYKPKTLVDVMVLSELRQAKGEMNKIGGLLKVLMTTEVVDPKEFRSTVNGLLLDFSRNQQSIDFLLSDIRSKIKF